MIQEDKKLLLKDLCARLLYGVKCKIGDTIKSVNAVFDDGSLWLDDQYDCTIDDIKPYLRPMSSMTEKEAEYLYQNFGWTVDGIDNPRIEAIDYMYSRHLDYRGLINKGLAIAVTEETNPYKS